MSMLVLWDIDHTLIETRGLGRALSERAFLAATGTPLRKPAAVAGRTELDIMRGTLRCNGFEPTAARVAALADALVNAYEDACSELAARGRVLPGVVSALAELAGRPDIRQSVLTGNLRSVARIKLETFDLGGYFDLNGGAYGDDATDRSALVETARARARLATGTSFSGKRTVLIGDTPNDVHAALASGARVIAVATGKSEAATLRDAGADVVRPGVDAELLANLLQWVSEESAS
ncbi:MAG: HAD family hydrolase [Sciscionella sp.]